MKRERLACALAANLNLVAYHLPLDAHPVLGNNAQLAQVLGLRPHRNEEGKPATCGPDNLVWLGDLEQTTSLHALSAHIESRLQRSPLYVGPANKPIKRVAWCTGGAQGMIDAAIAAGADAYISGEISEPTFHSANEMGIAYIAAGHHATERYGVQALGQAIAGQFGVQVSFIDLHNPV